MWGIELKKVLAAGVLSGLTGMANGASMWIAPTDSVGSIIQGNFFQVEIHMDFTDDPTIGGGFDILYDASLLTYVNNSFLISDTLGSDPNLTRDDNPAASTLNSVEIDTVNGKIVGAAFGDLIGLTGPSLVGTMTFLATEIGNASLSLTATANPAVGGFISTFTLEDQNVDFIGSSIEVSPVPLPAAVWLMFTGLAGIATVSRRQQA